MTSTGFTLPPHTLADLDSESATDSAEAVDPGLAHPAPVRSLWSALRSLRLVHVGTGRPGALFLVGPKRSVRTPTR